MLTPTLNNNTFANKETHSKISHELVSNSYSTQEMTEEELCKNKEIWRKKMQMVRAKNNF